MERLIVKFGTPKPIGFREYDENHPQIDLELEVKAAGTLSVTELGDASSGSDEEAVSKIREIALSSLSERIRSWPEGVSFWNNTTKAALEKYIDESLSTHGITAKTDLSSLTLTSESRELYDAVVRIETDMYVDIHSRYKNVIDGNEGQPVPVRKSP